MPNVFLPKFPLSLPHSLSNQQSPQPGSWSHRVTGWKGLTPCRQNLCLALTLKLLHHGGCIWKDKTLKFLGRKDVSSSQPSGEILRQWITGEQTSLVSPGCCISREGQDSGYMLKWIRLILGSCLFNRLWLFCRDTYCSHLIVKTHLTSKPKDLCQSLWSWSTEHFSFLEFMSFVECCCEGSSQKLLHMQVCIKSQESERFWRKGDG